MRSKRDTHEDVLLPRLDPETFDGLRWQVFVRGFGSDQNLFQYPCVVSHDADHRFTDVFLRLVRSNGKREVLPDGRVLGHRLEWCQVEHLLLYPRILRPEDTDVVDSLGDHDEPVEYDSNRQPRVAIRIESGILKDAGSDFPAFEKTDGPVTRKHPNLEPSR